MLRMRVSLRQGKALLFLLDALAVAAAFLAAFLIRFDLRLEPENVAIIRGTIGIAVAAYAASAVWFGLYRSLYHYASVADHLNIVKAVAAGAAAVAAAVLFVRQGQFPRSVLILHPLLAFLGIAALRLAVRLARDAMKRRHLALDGVKSVLVFGAGDLGEGLVRSLQRESRAAYRIVGFVDDDPHKQGMHVHGVRVLGTRSDLPRLLATFDVDELVVAIAARRGELVRAVMDQLRGLPSPPEVKVAPSVEEMLAGPRDGAGIRPVDPADLLNRAEIRLDAERIGRSIRGRTVLVTGAGGTIGLELCRQVLKYGPAKLVILESHATSLFYAEGELRGLAKGAALDAVLGDVRDEALVERVVGAHRPHVVLHAAAHKHVHQLETNVHEGITCNVLGTWNVARAADRHGAEVFLLISTDKAVKPRSVMGATKRVAELLVRGLARASRTRFTGVRFGNVLGSSGSVLRIFQSQIANGGPVTVTDERATRYFMTVEESVGLILQAVSMAKGGEVFVLKMGTPVRILDMAKSLILLSGLEPGKDIEIRITGLKQGEKLDEELAEDPSEMTASEHPDITLLKPDPGDAEVTPAIVDELRALAATRDPAPVIARLRQLIPTFSPDPAHTAT